MKKRNIICTVAAVLLYFVFITVYLLCGIFAKFTVSSGDGDDARVAKYGVSIITKGYVTDQKTELVPGFAETEGMIFSLSGKPEVAVSVGCELTGNDICLPKGFYHVDYGESTIQFIDEYNHESMEISNPDKYRFCFHVKEDYYPVKFNIYHRNDENSEWIAVENAQNITQKEISLWFKNEFNAISNVNTDLSELGEWKITCDWEQERDNSALGDQSYMDTLLCASPRIMWFDSNGDEINAPDGFYNHEKIEFSFEITQID